jgi:hypothetical protein
VEHRDDSDDLAARVGHLDERVSELKAQTGAEALELRARVRALEDRIEALVTERSEPRTAAEPRKARAGRKETRRKQRQTRPPRSEG